MDGILVIDKSCDWTSHDVVAKLRGILRERRIGHGGTLDPMATGVLPVFMGRATRAIELLPTGKTYIAKMRLGLITNTQDTTGNIVSKSENIPNIKKVEEVAREFLGDGLQIPPMVSAVKINGQRLYKLARQGIEVERKARPVTFSKIEVSGECPEVELLVECSGGAYIRTLCHDIGARLGCGAAMSGLRRIRSGAFDISQAVELESVALETVKILPVDSLFLELPAITATAEHEKKIRNGADYSVELGDGRYRVYSSDGEFLMLGEVLNKRMSTVKSFYEV